MHTSTKLMTIRTTTTAVATTIGITMSVLPKCRRRKPCLQPRQHKHQRYQQRHRTATTQGPPRCIRMQARSTAQVHTHPNEYRQPGKGITPRITAMRRSLPRGDQRLCNHRDAKPSMHHALTVTLHQQCPLPLYPIESLLMRSGKAGCRRPPT